MMISCGVITSLKVTHESWPYVLYSDELIICGRSTRVLRIYITHSNALWNLDKIPFYKSSDARKCGSNKSGCACASSNFERTTYGEFNIRLIQYLIARARKIVICCLVSFNRCRAIKLRDLGQFSVFHTIVIRFLFSSYY